MIAALAELGFDASKVEVSDTAKQLFDYHGHVTYYTDLSGDKANVIIRRQFVGRMANDIGFKRGSDGKYEAIISAYDRSCGYNEAWLGKLSAAYARHGIIQKATKQGFRFTGTVKKDGKTQLQFLDMRR